MALLRFSLHAIRMMLLFSIILFTLSLLSHVRPSSYFPIQTVRVYGASHIDKQDMQDTLTPLVTRGFFGIKVEAIRDRLLQMPWAEDILVRREWPNTVNVTVIERQAIATWNDNMLLSASGNIFEPAKSTYPTDLPHLYAPFGKQVAVLHFYEAANQILQPLHAEITRLEMTPFLSWKLTLNNGITLQAGQKDVLKRLSHLVELYPTIIGERAGDVEYIDLRYPNGVAVRWKEAIKT